MNLNNRRGEAGVSECLLSFRSAQAEDRDRDRHRLFARRFIEGFTNPYCIEYECAAGECAANLQSVEPFTKAVIRVVLALIGFFPSRSCRLAATCSLA